MSKHTPEPWFIDGEEDACVIRKDGYVPYVVKHYAYLGEFDEPRS